MPRRPEHPKTHREVGDSVGLSSRANIVRDQNANVQRVFEQAFEIPLVTTDNTLIDKYY
jgi:hypothetical protein